jgi:L-lysine 6-transaminase
MDGNVCNDIEAEEAKAYEQLDAAFAESADRIAAILIEPMQGEGGDNHFRPEFLAKLRQYADQHDCLLAYDEVQTGFFGSGKPWFWQHLGVAPDVVAFGKKSQVCGIYAGGKVDDVEQNVFKVSSRINSTWGGTLVDMVRSRRFIEIIVQDGLAEHAAALGDRLMDGLRSIARDTNAFGNIRGRGTLVAVTFPSAEHRAAAITALFDRKTMTLPCGTDSMRFRLPLTMSFEELDELLNRTAEAVRSAHAATLP